MDTERPELISHADDERLVARYGRSVRADDEIFREGSLASEVLLLELGQVRLHRTIRGVDRSLLVVERGALFGEEALEEGTLRLASAIAVTDVELLAFPRATFRRLIAGNGALSVRVVEQLARRLRDAEQQLTVLTLDDPPSRVLAGLLGFVASRPRASALPISPPELAARVALSVASVKREVHALRAEGLLRIVGEQLLIADAEALRRRFESPSASAASSTPKGPTIDR